MQSGLWLAIPPESFGVQIKSLTKTSPVPLGSKFEENSLFLAGYLIIVRNIINKPEVFITTPEDIRIEIHEGKVSYWLQPKSYKILRDNWDKIGKGFGYMNN